MLGWVCFMAGLFSVAAPFSASAQQADVSHFWTSGGTPEPTLFSPMSTRKRGPRLGTDAEGAARTTPPRQR